MNKIDRNFLIGMGVVSFGIYLALKQSNKNDKPVKLFDLNAKDTISMFGSLAVVSVGVLVVAEGYNRIIKKA
jgi:hypothetical protein